MKRTGNPLSIFLNSGKEYVCVLRLHDAIASETKLAQVSSVRLVDIGHSLPRS